MQVIRCGPISASVRSPHRFIAGSSATNLDYAARSFGSERACHQRLAVVTSANGPVWPKTPPDAAARQPAAVKPGERRGARIGAAASGRPFMEATMRVIVATFTALIVLAAISVQAAPVIQAKETAAERSVAPIDPGA
jgi:hypothetical protein